MILDHVGIAVSISVVKSLKVAVLLGLLARRLGIERDVENIACESYER